RQFRHRRAHGAERDRPVHGLAGAGAGIQDWTAEDSRAARSREEAAGPALRHPRLPRRGAGRRSHAPGRARETARRLDRAGPPGRDFGHGASLAGRGSLHFCGTRKPRRDSKPPRRFADFTESTMIRTGFIAAAFALAACGGGTSTAATHFTANLNAANEPGGVTSGGTGT